LLILLFTLGTQRFGVPALDVLAVLPMSQLRGVPEAPAHVAGLLDYGGRVLPVIDLCQLATNQPCVPRVSSRLLLMSLDGQQLGLLAEHVTEMRRFPAEQVQSSGLASTWLGGVVEDIQLVRAEQLLDSRVRDLLSA
jgi:chemotaxis-related protein WspB